jgi:hypothetical protein
MESKGFFSVNDQLLQVIEDSPKLTKEQEQALVAETGKLSISYVRDLCKHAARRSVTQLVHGVQYLLFWLLEKIYEKQQRDRNHFREKIATQLAAFLRFLQKQSAGLFNVDAPMPRYLWMPVHQELAPLLQKGKKFVLEQTEQELVSIIQTVYNSTTTQPTPSYRQAVYWQKLTEILVLNNTHPDNEHTKCVYTLLRFNFNHSLFVQYVFSCYVQAIGIAETAKMHWQQALQHINRVIPETGLVLLHDEEDCKRTLLKMIRNEMNVFSKEAENMLQQNLPYQYNLTVAQLAILFRLQTDTGILQTGNITEMLRYLAAHAVTSRADAIGAKSLYNNYHQPDRASLQIMMEYNSRMRSVLKTLLDKAG